MDQTERKWTIQAMEALRGLRILGLRYMTQEEADAMGWTRRPLVLVLEEGKLLYASMDDEGNDGGALHGQDKEGNFLGFPVMR